MEDCILCKLKDDKSCVVLDNAHAYAIYDKYPVNPGHLLIVPKRHMIDYFALTPEEETAIWQLVRDSKTHLDAKYNPDGYNIGINCGAAAGQTIFHLHVHVIPRYDCDMEEPEGGVRGVIPEKQKYKREEN